MAEYASTCAPTFVPTNPSRVRVALGTDSLLQNKIAERRARSTNEPMAISRIKKCPSVLVVKRPRKEPVYVLLGFHKPTVLYDDDGVRTKTYRPTNSPGSFHLARSAFVYDRLPGIVPVACTCNDFIMRATSTRGLPRGSLHLPPSVNDRDQVGESGAMGAVLGCKHMMAANLWLRKD